MLINNPITAIFPYLYFKKFLLLKLRNCNKAKNKLDQSEKFPKAETIFIGLYLDIKIAIAHCDHKQSLNIHYIVNFLRYNLYVVNFFTLKV